MLGVYQHCLRWCARGVLPRPLIKDHAGWARIGMVLDKIYGHIGVLLGVCRCSHRLITQIGLAILGYPSILLRISDALGVSVSSALRASGRPLGADPMHRFTPSFSQSEYKKSEPTPQSCGLFRRFFSFDRPNTSLAREIHINFRHDGLPSYIMLYYLIYGIRGFCLRNGFSIK